MKTREDWLCEQIDRDDLSDALRTQYEKELDRIAEARTDQQQAAREAMIRIKENREHLKAKILANEEDFIKSFGEEEFGEDYDIVQEDDKFVLYSKVANVGQADRRIHQTLEQADADLRYLLYNRLYDKYVRSGSSSNLSELYS